MPDVNRLKTIFFFFVDGQSRRCHIQHRLYFQHPSTAYLSLACANMLLGILTITATFILQYLALGDDVSLPVNMIDPTPINFYLILSLYS